MIVPACAKLNLVLSVGTRQPDGYHELDTVFHALDWHDDVEVTCTPVPGPPQLSVEGDPSVPTDASNLAWKAAALLVEAARLPCTVQVRLVKRIPPGGGLGGGSADAAAVLMGLNALVPEPLPLQELLDLAARLGSDVPFALLGHASARGWGRGERLAPLPVAMPLHFVLVVPPFEVSTPWCYQQWSPRAKPLEHGPAAVMAAALCQGDYAAVCAALHNDLQTVVAERHPQIETIRRALTQAGCDATLMTGSGSCVFGLVSSAAQAQAVAERLPTSLGRVVVSRSKVSPQA